MSAPAGHVHISEREVAHRHANGALDPSGWEDCLWTSVTEWLNDTYENQPDTLARAEALRDASGEPTTGGSNFTDVAKAFAKLHINVAVQALGFAAFWKALKPGTAGVALGSFGNFKAGSSILRFAGSFRGGHAVYVARVDNSDRVWWCDPLAPKGAYNGQWLSKADLQKFMSAGWTGIVRPLLAAKPAPKPVPVPPKEDAMPALATYTPGFVASLKGAKNVRSAPVVSDATKVRVTKAAGEKVSVVGTVTGAVPVGLKSAIWFVWYEAGKPVYIHESNATSVVAPVQPAIDPNPALEADIEAKAATINEQAAIIASQKTALLEAADLRARSVAAIDALKG